ncbi:hypothetical protein AJ80_00449 [Polytolypa hystricis UAMH7299]|uniref:DUF7730 domain-containing protein n=1 Tax=Polytolypa hystricis (strain UAMH7299) TaxID=1447883 RepID=A0A2B7Z3T1_POLH7|nr:hypothetical protein AJ80_00449 [Polytolypa hystricis UAMH7299]
MILRLLDITPTPILEEEREPIVSRLLQLPWELREPIYAYALEEPVRYARRHGPFCEFSERNTTIPETPPYQIDSPKCQCTRRQGIGLLLANRQIYHEASPLFWSRATFSFGSAETFAEGINADVGKRYRNSILHVRIDHEEYSNINESTLLSMWKALGSCKNLRTLTMDYRLLKQVPDTINIPDSLAHLETFHYFSLRSSYNNIYDCAYKVWGSKLTSEFGQTIPPHLVKSAVGSDFAAFTWNVHLVESWLHKAYLETLRGLVLAKRVCPKDYPRLKRGFDERHNKLLYNLKGGSPVFTVTVYGLPNCKTTHWANTEARRKRRRQWKLEGFNPADEVTPPVVLVKAAKKRGEKELQHKQRQFELAMKEKGIKIRKYKPDPEPEEPWITQRREKHTSKWRTRVRREDRLSKSELLSTDQDEWNEY